MPFDLDIYNARQKQAITDYAGPMLVISGAGTGKTHVLTGKILYLLLEKKIKPDEILALTFTEKAAQEMLQRIENELPIGYPEIWIKTFHSFCDNVLRERGFEIGIAMDYKILTEADLWMFLKKHCLDFGLNYYRSPTNPKKFLAEMQKYFSRLKDEDITPQKYSDYAKKLSVQAKSDEEKETAEKHLELSKAYEIYENLLMKNGYIDYGGLIFNALRLFEKRKSVLAEYKKRFKYILVDEFQDTNFAQNKIVTLLADDYRNLTVVGDDDQSIYKWRGASLTNIKYFQKLFPEAKKIVLNENYRNSQIILDLAYSVIQKNNPNRLEITESVDKKLSAVTGRKHFTPEFHNFENSKQEFEFVLKQAVASLKKGLDTAILVRTNALAKPFIEKLQRENFLGASIPYQHFSASSFLAKPGVKDCIALLRVLANPWDNVALYRCVSNKFWGAPMEEILDAMRKAKRSNLPLYKLLDGKPFLHIKNLLSDLIEYSRQHSVSEVLGRFLSQSGYLKKALSSESSESTDLIADINRFSEKVAKFEETHTSKTINDFLEFAEFIEEVGDPGIREEPLDSNALKILTIHMAKGLEFDACFIPGLAQWKFPSVSRKEPFEIPPSLIPESLPAGDHHLEEERRLFYVACTRAREILVLSCSSFYEGKKKWKPSLFISEAFEKLKTAAACPSAIIKTKEREIAQSAIKTKLDRRHKTIKIDSISYSQMDTFRTCPLKYKFRYLLNLPVEPTGTLNFGLSIHNTLRAFYEFMQKNPSKRNENLLQVLKKLYEENFLPYGYENLQIREDQKKNGLIMLKNYYLREKKSLGEPVFMEKAFKLKIGKIVLNGRMDRIDKLPDGTYEVIDYKTGEAKNGNLSKNLQLSIYALACRDFLKIPVSRLSLYFLPSLKKVSTARTDAELQSAKEEILKLAGELRASDLSPAPGYHCGYCDFRLICPSSFVMVR